MNPSTLLLIAVLLVPFQSRAQADRPFQDSYKCNTAPQLIKRDSLGTYWGCDAYICYEGKNSIKLFDANYHLLEEGENVLRICSHSATGKVNGRSIIRMAGWKVRALLPANYFPGYGVTIMTMVS